MSSRPPHTGSYMVRLCLKRKKNGEKTICNQELFLKYTYITVINTQKRKASFTKWTKNVQQIRQSGFIINAALTHMHLPDLFGKHLCIYWRVMNTFREHKTKQATTGLKQILHWVWQALTTVNLIPTGKQSKEPQGLPRRMRPQHHRARRTLQTWFTAKRTTHQDFSSPIRQKSLLRLNTNLIMR